MAASGCGKGTGDASPPRRAPERGKEARATPGSPGAARAHLEEALEKLGIADEEATPLVLDDREDEAPMKWLLAGKVLHRNLLHIQTITNALRPAWGNPRGLQFRSLGDNMFVAELDSKRDRDLGRIALACQ